MRALRRVKKSKGQKVKKGEDSIKQWKSADAYAKISLVYWYGKGHCQLG